MSSDHDNSGPHNFRPTFVRLTAETADGLDDLRYAQQRLLRRHVTKTELLEEAVRLLLAAKTKTNP